jgi:hypothetical protein
MQQTNILIYRDEATSHDVFFKVAYQQVIWNLNPISSFQSFLPVRPNSNDILSNDFIC